MFAAFRFSLHLLCLHLLLTQMLTNGKKSVRQFVFVKTGVGSDENEDTAYGRDTVNLDHISADDDDDTETEENEKSCGFLTVNGADARTCEAVVRFRERSVARALYRHETF